MISFDITFNSNQSLTFTDNTPLGDYAALDVSRTFLRVFTPLISEDSFEIIELYDPNVTGIINTLGDSTIIDTSNTPNLISMIDGVYRFVYVVELVNDDELCTEVYEVKDIDLLVCKKNIIKDILNTTFKDNCKGCEASFFDSALQTARNELTVGNYKEAEEIVEYLKNECKICDYC